MQDWESRRAMFVPLRVTNGGMCFEHRNYRWSRCDVYKGEESGDALYPDKNVKTTLFRVMNKQNPEILPQKSGSFLGSIAFGRRPIRSV